MKRGLAVLVCSVMLMAALCGAAFGEDGRETHIPYTVGSVCVLIPEEWDESGHDEDDGIAMYMFEFEENGADCEGALMSVGLEQFQDQFQQEMDLSEGLTARAAGNAVRASAEEGGFTLEMIEEIVNDREVVLLWGKDEDMAICLAVFVLDEEVAVMGVYVSSELRERSQAIVLEMVGSVTIVNVQ